MLQQISWQNKYTTFDHTTPLLANVQRTQFTRGVIFKLCDLNTNYYFV